MVGRRVWAIPEGYIPGRSFSQKPDVASREAACILAALDQPAAIELTLYFADREPAGPHRITIEPRRTKHTRFNDLADPERVPGGAPYSSVLRSNAPVVARHMRLDSRDPHVALLSTLALPVES
jgi:hypothetical protein